MPAFLRSSNARTPTVKSIHAKTKASTRSRRVNSRRAFVAFVLLLALIAGKGTQAASDNLFSSRTDMVVAASSLLKLYKKRLLMIRRNESPDGVRFTLMSDSPLDDYKSFAEGERVCVMIPQADFVSARNDADGRGFADMRLEQRDEDAMFSFRLQQGATVAFNQNFNRLDVTFTTNERANSKGLK